jgi:DNA-binding transcriptional ArsR family regulator
MDARAAGRGTGAAGRPPAGRDPARVARARRRLAAPPREEVLDRIRKAVCDVARLRILQALSAGPLTVDDLALVVERAPPATSQHLRVLRGLGLVEGRRRGTAVYYRLRPAPATDEVLAVARLLTQGAREAQRAPPAGPAP